MPRLLAVILLIGSLAVAVVACGESDADKAKDNACNAVDDINAQVTELQGLTLETATKDQIDENVNAIKDDLQKIKDALPDLESSLKSQLTSATQTFEDQVSKLASDLGQSVSLQDAAKQINADKQQLKSSYDAAFASVSC
jgi:DNA repair exonuclease SbcCD ATPase subunit